MLFQLIVLAVGLFGLATFALKMRPVYVAMRHARHLGDVRLAEDRCLDGDYADGGRADGRESLSPPLVSVIVPACNEEAAVERCLRSLLAQDYPAVEVIALDDRSTDRTGEIMERLACEDGRLRVHRVRTLPEDWLGKNHANYVGAGLARGSWLLFTDGDIIFQPDCLSRAVQHVQSERLHHLTLMPGIVCAGYWEKAICCLFALGLADYLKPWHLRNPLKPRSYHGVGAFNLVERGAYEAIGGHERLRLEVGDDINLGKLLKQGGFVSDILAGWPHVSLRWQTGLSGVVRGLEKNGFCGADYRVSKTIVAVLLLAVFVLMPIVGTLLAPGWTRVPFAVLWAAQAGLLGSAARRQDFSWTVGLGMPVAGLAMAWALTRSMLLALWRGGIVWRGTFYPLAKLRAGHV